MSCDVLYVTHPEVHTLGLEPDLGQGVTIQGPSRLYFGLSSAAYYHLLSLFETMFLREGPPPCPGGLSGSYSYMEYLLVLEYGATHFLNF